MMRRTVVFALGVLCALLIAGVATQQPAASAADKTHAPVMPKAEGTMMKAPTEGYNVHVLAPHLVDGVQSGPYHHYCKSYTPDPIIVCLIYESTDPNAMLAQVEWIYAKKLTRNQVSLKEWNKNWHDHKIEIASGRVKVLDMPEADAAKVAELVSTTDGLIYHFKFEGMIPNGKMSIAQAVGHKPMKMAEWKNYDEKPAAAGK